MANYFELLGLQAAFDIDLAALEVAYFKAQRQYHPDRFVGKPQPERMAALQRSADVNQAYETLKNPLKRAQYCLHLQGIQVGTEADNVKPSQAVLIEAMELREEPLAAGALEQKITESTMRIAQFYQAGKFDDMAQETLRLGYLVRTKKDVTPSEAEGS